MTGGGDGRAKGRGSLRGRFLRAFIPWAILVVVVGAIFYYQDRRTELALVQGREYHTVRLAAYLLSGHVEMALSDLVHQAASPALRRYLDKPSPASRDDLALDFLALIASKRIFDQVRFLDITGRERVRVNFNNGSPAIVEEPELQDKSHRYYFQKAAGLGPRQLYVSRLDLNMEKGKVEEPHKPMIRAATPVFDSRGIKRGVLVINYLARSLLAQLANLDKRSTGHLMLLNQGGYWLYGPRAGDNWAFMFPNQGQNTFPVRYPQAWRRMAESPMGQFITPAGLFSFVDVDPTQELATNLSVSLSPGSEIRWKMVSFLPQAVLEQMTQQPMHKTMIFLPLLLVAMALGFWLWARSGMVERRAAAALAQVESRYRMLFNSTQDAVFVNPLLPDGRPGRFVEVNQVAPRRLGYTREELLQLSPREIDHPSCVPHIARVTKEIVEHGQVLFQSVHVTKDGRTIPVEINAHLFDWEGQPTILAVARDITERKQHEAAMEAARRAAEQAAQAKSQFLANMSHEIRTPMNAVMGMTDLVLASDLDSRQREYLEMVKASAGSLLKLLDDILDLSKIEAGRLEVEDIPFDLREALNGAMDVVAMLAQEKGLELILDVETSLPRRLSGDPNRLRQVALNLLGNAVKFTRAGQVVLRARPQTSEDCQLVIHFTVEDTGIGIPPEKQKEVFQPFTQADSSITRAYGGTGLGLSVASQLVDLMGGHCWAESQPGRGSAFHFLACFGLVEDQGEAPGVDLAGQSILLVVPNSTVREVLAHRLEDWGGQVWPAAGRQEALDLVTDRAQGRLDLVVADASRQEGDWPDLLRDLAEAPGLAGLRVILLIRLGQETPTPHLPRSLARPVYLVKPVKDTGLAAALEGALGQAPEPAAAATPARAAEPGAGGGLEILLAEDNPVNQKLALALLQAMGHRVTAVDNGAAALDAMDQRAFDLVLMDVQMPIMDGLEATARIRASEVDGDRVPIIALTAHAMQGDRERCLTAGMDAYLTKPIDQARLLAAITELTGGDPGGEEPGPAMAEDPRLDPQALLGRFEGDAALVREMVGIFLEDSPNQVAAIRAALEAGDATALAVAAHSFKGAVGYFASPATREAAYDLEKLGKAGDLERAAGALRTLEERLARLNHDLESFLADQSLG